MLPSAQLAFLLFLVPAQADPGLVVVAEGDLAQVIFEVPGYYTPYRLNYSAGGPATVWFDREATILAEAQPATYFAKSKGDFNADDALDASDAPGFVAAVLGGVYDPEADFNDDLLVDETDVARFAEAVVSGFPADGVVLYVRAQTWSQSLGDQPLELLTDPDLDGAFTVALSRPMTFVYFESFSGHNFGAPIEFFMTPAIPPLAFDENTTATWRGYAVFTAGTTGMHTVRFDAEQVRERAANQGDVLIGDGRLEEPFPAILTLGSVSNGAVIGRTTFDFNGIRVTTKEFSHTVDIENQLQFNYLDFDIHDPGGYPPEYGTTTPTPRILAVNDPDEPELDTFWGYHFAMEVPLVENADTLAWAPSSFTADMLAYDAQGTLVDSVTEILLTRIDDDNNPFFISYRSELELPFILVDTAVDEAAFPDLRVVLVSDGGYLVVVRR